MEDASGIAEIVRVDDLDVLVRFAERRSVRLTVERDSAVTATVPPGISREELVKLVRSRRRWLYGKLADRASLGETRDAREFLSGEGFPYLGRSYRLLLVDEGPGVRLLRGRLELPRVLLEDPSGALITWYRRRGEAWLPGRIRPWAERMAAPYTDLKVMPLGYRWGSCSRGGRLNLHWAAMQLPPDLIDYVLVHELAHLHVPDHSEHFWHRVERAMPDYSARRSRLKALGPGLWLPSQPKRSRWRTRR